MKEYRGLTPDDMIGDSPEKRGLNFAAFKRGLYLPNINKIKDDKEMIESFFKYKKRLRLRQSKNSLCKKTKKTLETTKNF